MPPAECHGRPTRAPAWVKTAMAHWEGRAALGPGSVGAVREPPLSGLAGQAVGWRIRFLAWGVWDPENI